MVGGLIGLGSFVYGLLRVGTTLGEESLIRSAKDLTTLFTPARIAEDVRGRLQTGSAGAVLALLALHRALPEPDRDGRTPLQIAFECARHLLDTRASYEGRPRAWPLAPGKPPLGDFCYGAAGISYALLRLYEAVPRPELWDAAQEGLSFVRGLYSPEHKNWRDIRAAFEARFKAPEGETWRDWWYAPDPTARPVSAGIDPSSPLPTVDAFLNSWCHGGAGIALGRLAALPIDDTPEARQEIAGAIEIARAFARAEPFSRAAADDMCCGHMGRAEVLLSAHQILGDEELLADARMIAHRVWRRARDEGRYCCSASRGTDAFCPSLFQGEAGIGYSYLRLAFPEALPSLLLLD
jgi:lantibiotic modifying enzyme